jgi:hypothetical protein
VILEPFDPSLRDASTREEEVFGLITIEIAVVGKGEQDGNIANGEGTGELVEFFLGEALAGMARMVTNKERTTK